MNLSSYPSNCPDCGSKLVKRHRRDGSGAFWGCSAWSKNGGCRFTREDRLAHRPITWKDNFRWARLQAQYLSIGSSPSFLTLENADKLKVATSKTLLLTRISNDVAPSPYREICDGLCKMLLRGEYAFPGFAVEAELLNELPAKYKPKPLTDGDPEIGYEDLISVTPESVLSCLASRFSETVDFKPLNHLSFDSEREASFFTQWIPKALGSAAVAWFTPQAPLDMLLNSLGEDAVSFRRCDFMFYVPGHYPIIIEIDGDDHQRKRQADKARDAALLRHKIDTIRIPNAEIDKLWGPNLKTLEERCNAVLQSLRADPEQHFTAETLLKSSECSQLQFALVNAVSNGFPVGTQGTVKVVLKGDLPSVSLLKATFKDLNELLSHYSGLFGIEGIKPLTFVLEDDATKSKNAMSVKLQLNASPAILDEIEAEIDTVLCRAILPCELLPPKTNTRKKLKLTLGRKNTEKHLTFFLNYVFRKRAFRGQQLDAIVNVLSDKDTLVLQPTGAGKSIIYQLSGLLMPGVTIVIDPIKALIEDQVRGLKEHRISRAAGLMSNDGDPLELQQMMAAISANHVDFILMSPERLLIQSFRDALASLMRQTTVNLAVIDEAHCLSQWGHEFRFAYLRLAENLRKYCSDTINGAPKLLAMTGTASRTVLKEMIAEIGIRLTDEASIIKPTSFNRKELQFSVLRLNKGGATFGELNNTLKQIPKRLNKEPEHFYALNGRKTNSGIIFTPHARGATHGLIPIRDQISKELSGSVGVFASTAPKEFDRREWEIVKNKHAEAFKQNKEPILIATKAFGMGVDKPNIRWTVHMGIPSSLEAFYQEAGRAGRDRKPSHCAVIYSETDENYTNQVLDPSNSLEEMKKLYQDRKPSDDVDRALFFHLNSFTSVRDELRVIKSLLKLARDCSGSSTHEIAYTDDWLGSSVQPNKEDYERAIVRMSYCALIDDYTTNYSAKTFRVTFAKYDFKRSKQKLENYISKVQPAKLRACIEEIDKIALKPLGGQPALLCEMIIKFTYDTIERSRRRMMLEAIQMARNGIDDTQIRERLLSYLEEGANAARVSELAEAENLEFSAWFELSDSIASASDARELRGDVSRILESYPYHAGLLLIRSISEALSGNGNSAVIKENLKAALINDMVNKVQLNDVLSELLNRTTLDLQSLVEPLLTILFEGFESDNINITRSLAAKLKGVSEGWPSEQRNTAIQFVSLVELGGIIPALAKQSDNLTKALNLMRN
jgi:ATP-dependent DNA helicase RecQ